MKIIGHNPLPDYPKPTPPPNPPPPPAPYDSRAAYVSAVITGSVATQPAPAPAQPSGGDALAILNCLVVKWTRAAAFCRADAERLGMAAVRNEILRDAAQYEQSIYEVGLAIAALAQQPSAQVPWMPLDSMTTPPTGRYVVGHRGYAIITHYLNGTDTEWAVTAKIGWQKDPFEFGATHYFPLPPLDSQQAAAPQRKQEIVE